MSTTPDTTPSSLWPGSKSVIIEVLTIIVLAILVLFLRIGSIDFMALLSYQLGLSVIGSLFIWFGNKFVLEYLLQSRINSNKVTQFLPLELAMASVAVTSIIYFIFYPLFIYLDVLTFVLPNFLQGLFATCGLSLLIVIIYAGNQIWKSWWSDGEFLFQPRETTKKEAQDFITLKNAKGSTRHELNEVRYFISESKITFLVDKVGKKWITQYTLSELEDMLDSKFFRLNRSILVSREEITRIRKLPNHRLLVTVGPEDEEHTQTISRYKSTRFKQWYDENNQ